MSTLFRALGYLGFALCFFLVQVVIYRVVEVWYPTGIVHQVRPWLTPLAFAVICALMGFLAHAVAGALEDANIYPAERE